MTDLAQKLADAAVQAIATQCPVSTGDRAREVAAHAIRQSLATQSGEAVAWIDEATQYYDPSTAPVPPAGHPLQKLGEYLAAMLDEDQWATAEQYLFAAWAAVGWIPVSERLPDMPSGYVLVHCEGGNITNDFFCREREFHRHAGGHYSRKTHGKESGYFQCSHRYGYRVTHWQPLPAAPAATKEG